jgi:glutamate racemase
MKIGVFDSGLGGLFTLSAIAKVLPEYDYVYLGDTKRLPYGSRSQETIYEFLKEGVDFLFAKDCALIIVACNTASAEALRELQQNYLPKQYPGRNVLGMIVPMTEASAKFSRVGLVATSATVSSKAYDREFKKRAKKSKIFSLATPLLVPFIEQGEIALMRPALKEYLEYFRDKKIDALLLGCTHYGIAKNEFKKILPKGVAILSQDTVVPKKTKEYLVRHPEIVSQLSKKGTRAFYVTDITPELIKLANTWFGKAIQVQKVVIEKSSK